MNRPRYKGRSFEDRGKGKGKGKVEGKEDWGVTVDKKGGERETRGGK